MLVAETHLADSEWENRDSNSNTSNTSNNSNNNNNTPDEWISEVKATLSMLNYEAGVI